MSKTRVEATSVTPILDMVTVEKTTATLYTSGIQLATANNTYMIHFSLKFTLSNFDSLYKVKLRFRQLSTATNDAYLYESTEGYLNKPDSKKLNYLIENGVVYREIDMTEFFGSCFGQTRYFAITSTSDLKLYTMSATADYKPQLVVERIATNDLLPNQVTLDGSVGDDLYSVNLRSGKMYYDKHLLSVNTTKSVIDLSISYNIEKWNTAILNTGIYTGLGKGFKFNYQQVVYLSGDNYIYYDASYRKHIFKLANNLDASLVNKVYYDDSGNYTILKVNSANFEMINGNQTKTFDSLGRLIKIATKITDSITYEENITYDSNNRITTVYSGDKNINISYGENVTLTSNDGRSVTIEIDSNTLISKITNVNGLETNYTYEETSGVVPFSRAIIDQVEYILSGVEEGYNAVAFTYSENRKVLEIATKYNSNTVKKEVIEYLLNQRKVLSYSYISTSSPKNLAIEQVFNYNDLGEVESSYEIVDNKVCSLKCLVSSENKKEYIALNSGSEKYSDDITVAAGTSTTTEALVASCKGEHVLSLVVLASQNNAYDIGQSYPVYASIYVNGVSKEVLFFNASQETHQVQYMKLDLNENDAVTVMCWNGMNNNTVEFKSICLSPKPANNVLSCINLHNSEESIASLDETNLYSNSINKIVYTDSSEKTITDITMSANDIAENQRLASLTTSYNLWYNDGADMLYNVTNVKVANDTYSIGLANVLNVQVQKTQLPDTDGNLVTSEVLSHQLFNTEGLTTTVKTKLSNDDVSNVVKTVISTYDKQFNLLKENDNGISETTYTYDSDGNNTSVTMTHDNLSIVQTSTFDTLSQPNSVTNEGVTTNFTYNNLGNVTSVSNSKGVIKNIAYKSDLKTINNVNVSMNSTTLINNFVYNSVLEVAGYNDARTYFTYEYDSYGRIKKVKQDGTALLTYTYTVTQTTMTVVETNQASETKTYTLDKYGRLLTLKEGSTVVATYVYEDQQGIASADAKLISKTIKEGSNSKTTTYNYNRFGALSGKNEDLFSYEKASGSYADVDDAQMYVFQTNVRQEGTVNSDEYKVTELQASCNITETKCDQYNYQTNFKNTYLIFSQVHMDGLNRQKQSLSEIRNAYNILLLSFQKDYVYASNGNSTKVQEEILTNIKTNSVLSNTSYTYSDGCIATITKNGNTTTFTYDKLNRLQSEVNPILNINRTYTYDASGNVFPSDKTMTYSGQKLTSCNGQVLSYDSCGRLIKYGSKTITFEKNRLVSYNGISFKYDGEGRRFEKTSSSQTKTYYYDDNRLIKEKITTTSSTKYIDYIYGVKGVEGFIYDNNMYYYERNILGDVVAIYNQSGSKVAAYEYDAWGNHTITLNTNSIATINPIRYRGYYYDVETQLYWVSSRYYSPELCRWISPDSIEYLDPQSINGLNLYAYCGNDPVNRFDPTGHAFISILVGLGIAALIGAGIGAASYTAGQLIDYAITGDFEWSWGGFFGSTIGGAVGGMIAYALPYIGIGSAAVGAFFSGAATTAGTMIGQNITDNAGYSAMDILFSSAITGVFSAVSVGVMSRIRIPGLNAGRGSYSAVSSQMYTKFRNQTISRITMRTFGKMLAAEAYSGIAGAIFEDAYDYSGADDWVLNWF